MTLSSFPCFLFLDIDGVLTTENEFRRRADGSLPDRDAYGHLFDDESVRHLDWLVRESGAGIVLSSAWRTRDLRDERITPIARQEWCVEPANARALWEHRGMPGRIVDCTPYCSMTLPNGSYVHLSRGVEIDLWQRQHRVEKTPYAIVDDDGDFLLHQQSRFVQTNSKDGLTRSHAETLLALLRMPVRYPWEE